MELGLDERVFVIGGGSSGLGLATARALVAEGARVVLAARGSDRLDAAVETLGPERAVGVAVDLADAGTPRALVDLALARFGRLDGALVNTGGARLGPVTEMADEDWDAAAKATLLGPIRLASTVIAHLRGESGSGGSIAFVLSSSAKSPIPGIALSNAIRPGLAMHVKDLADHYGSPPRSVRVVGLLPYRIATERGAGADAPDLSGIPLRRVGEPEEFGRAAAFVLSDAASYITGSLISLDGGALRAL